MHKESDKEIVRPCGPCGTLLRIFNYMLVRDEDEHGAESRAIAVMKGLDETTEVLPEMFNHGISAGESIASLHF